jgi:hypothetical protein
VSESLEEKANELACAAETAGLRDFLELGSS